MILSEPSRTSYDVNFRIFGVSVRIHPLFWLVGLIMAGSLRPSQSVVWVLTVLVSITIHELGHVAAFRYYGIRSYVVLYSFGGLAIPAGRSAYGGFRMPPLSRGIVAFAGPAVQMLSGFLLLGAMKLGGAEFYVRYDGILRFLPGVWVDSSRYFTDFANFYFFISIFWALVNLLPIIPLDGGQIAQAMFESADSRTGTRQALILSMITAGLVAALMVVEFRSWFAAIFFAYLGAMNYQTFSSLHYRGDRW